ncbi:unnamed protein product [Durusdinium trenchii]|uniref:Uncharacterized protein n=1 Tax=Durusdinium trenchii TaxID=1381693 RepID=A0ABP0LV19_9DINO
MTEQVGLKIITLSPLEIHFSQTRIRSEFQDGRSLQMALDKIEDKEVNFDEDALLLVTPFPRIEVTRWRCKLRDETGAARVDANGMELYSQEERWFSFDNRRLWCLQIRKENRPVQSCPHQKGTQSWQLRAAVKKWPKKVYCEVFEISQTLAKTRELRKFDTRTFGLSVLVGRREELNLEKWCWKTEVGLPVETAPEEGVALSALRQRKGLETERGQISWRHQRKSRRHEDEYEETQKFSALEILRGLLLFMIIYLGLRVCVILFQKYRLNMSMSSNSTVGVNISL